jgi:hypothetical protein
MKKIFLNIKNADFLGAFFVIIFLAIGLIFLFA